MGILGLKLWSSIKKFQNYVINFWDASMLTDDNILLMLYANIVIYYWYKMCFDFFWTCELN